MISKLSNASKKDTICSVATGVGVGAIAIIRISGTNAIELCDRFFFGSKTKKLTSVESHTIHFGCIRDEDKIIDEVLISVFIAPNSFTGENSVEISCHASPYIIKSIIELLIKNGARHALRGEFTYRAFMNNKYDLTQAEAISDLIASNSESSHQLALQQMRGGFSNKISALRRELIDYAGLIELELDFSEEDVEFANRDKLIKLLSKIKSEIKILIESFSLGNAIKEGIPVAIIGKPNVGKSTLLNTILNEERAIVSAIPGTTRDIIEDTFVINGILFRFIDTAGLRKTSDEIESIGLERTQENIKKASIILYVFDINTTTPEELNKAISELEEIGNQKKQIIVIANKTDLLKTTPKDFEKLTNTKTLFLSAKHKDNIELLFSNLVDSVNTEQITNDTITCNARHHEALSKALSSIENVDVGLETGLSSDLLATDLRGALYFLGEITGEITTDDILETVFERFCVGK